MAGTFWKWLVPGALTVIAGTALAVTQTDALVGNDLSARAIAALAQPTFSWAHVSVDGRDAVLTGTATSQAAIDSAAAKVAAVTGIRAVASNVALAEPMTPFGFSAAVSGGQVTLSGGYPDESIHAAMVAAAGKPNDTMRLASGAPADYDVGAKFALIALADFDEGLVALSDSSLSIEGRAKSPAAFDALQKLQQSAPAGIRLATLRISPPLVSPYIWAAEFDGTRVTITGNAPTADLADKLRAAAPANVSVSTTLSLASGEPSNFEANTLALLESLLELERGKASITGDEITLSGAPASSAIADRVTAEIGKLGGTVTLEPPRVADYTLDMQKASDTLSFSGFVPDAATREKLGKLGGADVSKLSLGRGAPQRFASAVDFGLGVLAHLSEGQVTIKGERLSLGGRAATIADFKAINDLLAQGAPQGLSIAVAEIHPPIANPFTFSAVKADTGMVTISGYVSDEATRKALRAKVSDLASDTADPADGAPKNFAFSAGKGLEILALLDSGSVIFDGTNWAIDGNVDTPQKGFAADAAYSVAGLRTLGWSYSVHLPEAKPAEALPIIAPYVWRAQKSSDGAVSFSGFVPSEGFKNYLKVRAANANDSTVLGAGAPADFGTSAAAGLDALASLDDGALGLAGEKWTLTGSVGDAKTRDAIQAALSARINPANWQVAIQAKDSAAVASPYLWSATKAADGSVELSGYLPSDSLKSFAAVRAGTVSRDSTAIASGEPAGFADDLLAGLDALSHLSQGKAAFDGSAWHLTGSVASAADGDAAMAALTKGSKSGGLWDHALIGYPAAAPTSAPSTEPLASSTPDITSLAPASEASSTEPSVSSEASSSESAASEPTSSSSEEASSASAPEMSSSEAPASEAVVESYSSSEDREIAPTTLTALPPIPNTLVFEANRKAGGTIALSGSVPADATAAYFGVLAGGVKTDKLETTGGLPDDFTVNGTAGLNALTELSEGHLGFDGTRWWLRGKAEQQPVVDDVNAKIAALPDGKDWSVGVDVLAAIDVCRVRVGAVAKRNAITFKSGTATLIASSMPVLDELAGDMQLCPKAMVHVQAHTDGDGDKDGNVALSVSRAEAVVAELVKRGLDEGRLYAEGFGESDPVAPNDTKDGKAKNRRIAFQFTEE